MKVASIKTVWGVVFLIMLVLADAQGLENGMITLYYISETNQQQQRKGSQETVCFPAQANGRELDCQIGSLTHLDIYLKNRSIRFAAFQLGGCGLTLYLVQNTTYSSFPFGGGGCHKIL